MASYNGTVKLFATELGNGVTSNSYKGITKDKDSNMRASSKIYEGTKK